MPTRRVDDPASGRRCRMLMRSLLFVPGAMQGAWYCREDGRAASGLRHPRLATIWSNDDERCTTASDHGGTGRRSEEHTSEHQSLMRISYAAFCLKKQHKITKTTTRNYH